MKTLNPGAQTISTLILVKLIWSTDEQFSGLWLGKAYPYTDQDTTGFSTVSFSQLHIMVTLFFKKAGTGTKIGGSQLIVCVALV